MSTLVTFLTAQNDYTGTLAGYAKSQEITPAQATADAMEAAASGDVTPNVIVRGTKSILTASLSKRAVRKINRASRAARVIELTASIDTALVAARPLKIGAIVEATGAARGEVLDALRAGRDSENPSFYSFNTTGSNFHMSWSNEPTGVTFPVPVVEAAPETPVVDESAGVDADVENDEG
jgi:hypothetical protein